jgi:2-polyprenyl-3-methyl-5-hydroxy-6-metoxy-1,4-benzoquinol methylase
MTMSAPAAIRPKDAGYYDNRRPDLVEMLPRPIGRVLEVGCGAGTVAAQLREEGAGRIVGIEPDPGAAAEAKGACDEVLVTTVETALDELAGPFDTIICHDVLEHLVDPWRVLRRLREVCAPGGRLQVSVPNARHISLVLDLVFRGTFGYTEFAHRDVTHLRWFTRKDIVRAIGEAGWNVTGVGRSRLSKPRRVMDRLTFGLSTEFLVLQWYVLATRD